MDRLHYMLDTAWASAHHETRREVYYDPYYATWDTAWANGIATIHDTMKSPDVNGTMGPERHTL